MYPRRKGDLWRCGFFDWKEISLASARLGDVCDMKSACVSIRVVDRMRFSGVPIR
jgi:hypothetical protein